MTIQQGLAFALMAGAVALFISGRLRYDLAALIILVLSVLTGVVPADRMFSGFADDLIWIIASVLVLSAAIARSGVIESAFAPLLSRLPGPGLQAPAFAGAVMLLSMATKNIGALAIIMPIALQTAKKTNVSPSRVLLPMSFASLLGGLVTLVGTSPNIIVSSVRETLLGHPYQLFDFAPVGLVVCAVGFAFLAVAPNFIRIDRPPPRNLDAALEGARYTTELTVPEESIWIGKTFAELDALGASDVDVLGVVGQAKRKRTPPERLLAVGDSILVEGEQADLEKFAAAAKLDLAGERHREESERPDEVKVTEGVIAQNSPLVGRTVAQARLYERFGVSLLAVSRSGERLADELRSIRLRSGDVVIFKAGDGDIGEAFADLHVLPLSERGIALGVRRFGFAPILLLALAVVAIALRWAPVHVAFAAAAIAVLALRVMSMAEAYRAVDGPVLVLLAALIPISEAIDRTGGAALIAAPLSQALQPLPPLLATGCLILVGMAVTPFLNNAATVLILAPIAAAVAMRLHVNPDAYLMAVAVGAACDFLTPIGHQCNTLVMGPGGYRFSDYWRLGLPLSLLVILVATPMITLVWAARP